jgi:hypothetical protein
MNLGELMQGPPLLRPFNPNERRDNFSTDPFKRSPYPDDYSTEILTTWQMPDRSWANVPSLWMGPQGPVQFKPNDEEGILSALRNYEQINGSTFGRHLTLDEALQAATERSRKGGAGSGLPR